MSQLSKYPALNNFEKQTSVPKVYAVLGLAGLYFFLIFFNIAGEFLVNIAGFIIPGYYSLSALFSASKVDDTQVRQRITKCMRITRPGSTDIILVVDLLGRLRVPDRV